MYVNHASVQPGVSIGWLADGGHAVTISEPVPQTTWNPRFRPKISAHFSDDGYFFVSCRGKLHGM